MSESFEKWWLHVDRLWHEKYVAKLAWNAAIERTKVVIKEEHDNNGTFFHGEYFQGLNDATNEYLTLIESEKI